MFAEWERNPPAGECDETSCASRIREVSGFEASFRVFTAVNFARRTAFRVVYAQFVPALGMRLLSQRFQWFVVKSSVLSRGPIFLGIVDIGIRMGVWSALQLGGGKGL